MIDLENIFGAARCESWETYPTACKTCKYSYNEKITLSDGNTYYGCNRDKILNDSLVLLKEQSDEINRLNRELDAMNRLSEMQMKALQEAVNGQSIHAEQERQD